MHNLDYKIALTRLSSALPLHAEEGPVREVIPEAELIAQVGQARDQSGAPAAMVAVIRLTYEALGLLDPIELRNGNWSFVSFPASLVGRSVLETLATERGTFVEAGYWVQGIQRPVNVVEEQRQILHRMESRRISSSGATKPIPIRTVHVAWGLIRLGGSYLLRAREDRRRPDVSGFVFPGGRLDYSDLTSDRQSPDALRELSQVDSTLAAISLPRTLARELAEELGLEHGDFTAAHQRTLAPFEMLEGSRNNHALTQYNIAVFSVRLHSGSELKVLDRISVEQDDWAWFTPTELAAARRIDGKTAFVDALSKDLGSQTGDFLCKGVPDSSGNPLAFPSDQDSIEIPSEPDQPLVRGMSGRERPLSFIPTRREWELLMVLAWHIRGFALETRGASLCVLGAGWIRLDDPGLLETARNLARRLQECAFPIVEVRESGHCRLSTSADQIYLDPRCFAYSWCLDDARKSLVLTLNKIETEWAVLSEKSLRVTMAPNFVHNLAAVESGRETKGDFEKEARTHFEPARALGLRRFISSMKGALEIRVPCAPSLV